MLGDALSVQRVYLHRDESAEVTASGGPAPGVDGVEDASGLIAAAPTAPTRDLLSTAGLTAFVAVAAENSLAGTAANPLEKPAITHVEQIAGGHPSLSAPIRTVGSAAAWWVGFFATIRHRGVHHVTLTPVTSAVTVQTLSHAARIVALGAALRLAEAHLRCREKPDPGGERVYCAAVAASVQAERRLPELIEELGELRLVDLVTLAIPWRGRFTKYAGGTGAGQAE